MPTTTEQLLEVFPPIANATNSSHLPGSPTGGGTLNLPGSHEGLAFDDAVRNCLGGHEWHNNHIRLVASMVSQGMSDTQITFFCRSLTLPNYTTEDTDRETAVAIHAAQARGVLAVEMEAAAIYTFAAVHKRTALCLAHVTNTMARVKGDFEKGDGNGSTASLQVIAALADAVIAKR